MLDCLPFGEWNRKSVARLSSLEDRGGKMAVWSDGKDFFLCYSLLWNAKVSSTGLWVHDYTIERYRVVLVWQGL